MWHELRVLKVGGLWFDLLLYGIQFLSDCIKDIFGVSSTDSCLLV